MIDQSRDFFLSRYFPFSFKYSAGYQVCWFVLKLEKGEGKEKREREREISLKWPQTYLLFFPLFLLPPPLRCLNLPGCSKIQEAERDSVEGERMTNNPTLLSLRSVSLLKIGDTRPLQLLHAILEQSMS